MGYTTLSRPLSLARHRGSISAEHGLGFKKAQFIHYSKSPEAVKLMKDIKRVFDPKVTCSGMNDFSQSTSRTL